MEASESLQSPDPAASAVEQPADPVSAQEPVSEQPTPDPTVDPAPVVQDAPAPAQEPTATPEPVVQPVSVNNVTRRSDDDVPEGHFAVVQSGEHAGQVGAFVSVATYGEDGYPESVLIRFRDHNYHTDTAAVPYADIRPAEPYRGGR